MGDLPDYLANRFGKERIEHRQLDELLGLAKGLIADGAINQAEVDVLHGWLAANDAIIENPIVQSLYTRVSDILVDGLADNEECLDLFETLTSLVGGNVEGGESIRATTLPLCKPAPTIEFEGRRFCFTGTFTYGKRKECEAVSADMGGSSGSLTKATNFLVIGQYATESWKHSSFGNKVLKAVEYREAGLPLHIVSEEHWRSHLTGN